MTCISSIVVSVLALLLLETPGNKCPVPELPSLELQFEEDFENAPSVTWRASDPEAWAVVTRGGTTALAQHKSSAYEPPHRSPRNIALLPRLIEGSFVLEADLQQTGRDYAHRDMCVFFCFEARDRYGYVHLSRDSDDRAHHIQIVNRSDRSPITTSRTKGVDWGKDRWHRVRVVFDAGSKRLSVYFNDMERPVLATDRVPFSRGHVGFGSFDDEGMVDNIKLWAKPGSTRLTSATFFEPVTSD